jgi:Flp pilus assembly protein TadG
MTLPGLLARFRADYRGTSAVIFAFSMVPMIGILGIGVDYSGALSRKARLDAAADAAAVAAITAARDYIVANGNSEAEPGLTNDAVTAGQKQGAKTFALDASADASTLTGVPSVLVARNVQTITATVTYAAASPTTFGGMFGVRSFAVGSNTGSSLTLGSYLDFYLALDVSGSMGLPTSVADETKLQNVNGGCQFACHYSGNDSGYKAARANGIKLRIDSVGTAVAHLVQTAINTETLPNQYRIGAYPFVDDVMQAAALSYTFSGVAAVGAGLADNYLDAGLSTSASQSMGAGGTHFEKLLPDMQNYVKTIGTGINQYSPKPFLFIVTDGMDNNQVYSNNNFNGSQPQEPNNFGYCQYAQSIGVVISILYIPYQPVINPTAAQKGESDQVNKIIPKIPADLQSCASPGFFFTANTDTDIDNALQAMFNQAVRAARLIR